MQDQDNTPNTQEVIRGFRMVDLPKYGEVKLVRPGYWMIEEADRAVGVLKRKMLLDKDNKLASEVELRREYEERGIWTKKDETEYEDLRRKIVAIDREQKVGAAQLAALGIWVDENDTEIRRLIEAVYAASEDPEDLQVAYQAYSQIRNKRYADICARFVDLKQQRDQLFTSTVESVVEYERQLILCARCYTKDDKPVWPSADALKHEEDIEAFNSAMNNASRFWAGIDSEEWDSFFDALRGAPRLD